ncbi:MAG: tetratricopeptide repeat protein [Deltaproteobacteria bacterium]|nr:tetratricopeptide repeat protein [Deltaproteobacteria bacterium]
MLIGAVQKKTLYHPQKASRMEVAVKKLLCVVFACGVLFRATLCPAVDTAALLAQGQQYENEQKWSEAFSTYSELLKYEPQHAEGNYRLGRVSERLGSIDSALKSYQAALQANPGMAEAKRALAGYYMNRGVGFRLNKQSAEAIQALQQALTYDPTSAGTHFELGQEYEQQRQLDSAVTSYQEAIKLDANHSQAHTRLASVYTNQGKHDDAVREYQEVLRLNPEDPAGHHGLGVAYSELGQREQAISSLKQAIRFYLRAGHRDKAQPAYTLQKKLEAELYATPTAGKKK